MSTSIISNPELLQAVCDLNHCVRFHIRLSCGLKWREKALIRNAPTRARNTQGLEAAFHRCRALRLAGQFLALCHYSS